MAARIMTARPAAPVAAGRAVAPARRSPAPATAFSYAAANGKCEDTNPYAEELKATAAYIAQRGRGM